LDDLLYVVAVDADNLPPKGPELAFRVAQTHDLVRRPALLDVVPIQDGDKAGRRRIYQRLKRDPDFTVK
jgi:hypothetical protein